MLYHECGRVRRNKHCASWEVYKGASSDGDAGDACEVQEWPVNFRNLHEVPLGVYKWGYARTPGFAERYMQSRVEFSLLTQNLTRANIPYRAFVACLVTEVDVPVITEVQGVDVYTCDLDDVNTRLTNWFYRKLYPATPLTGQMVVERDNLAYGVVVAVSKLSPAQQSVFKKCFNISLTQ